MKIFFIRHGQSEQNLDDRIQNQNGGLSELGKKQSDAAGKFLSSQNINVIFSSSFERAKQSANIINRYLRVYFDDTNLFDEQKIPSEFVGLKKDDPKLDEFNKKMWDEKKFHDESWHFSDEENFADVKNRVGNAITFLNEYGKENIAVVSHSAFMKLMILDLIFDGDITSHDFLKFRKRLRVYNGGITVCEKNDEGKWVVLTWNHYTHLGSNLTE